MSVLEAANVNGCPGEKMPIDTESVPVTAG